MIADSDATAAPPPTHAPGGLDHLPQLDGLRGVAILFVLVEHSLGGSAHGYSNVLVDFAVRAAHCGWVGVDLFFVLSGFLITRILLRTSTSRTRYQTFYARRALRIWPVYFALVACTYVAAPYLHGSLRYDRTSISWPLVVLFCQNLPAIVGAYNVPAFLNATWSLAIEEQFYIFWPSFVFHFRRSLLWKIALFVVVASPALRLLCAHWGASPGALYYFTPTRLDGLAGGALVALYVTSPGASLDRLAKWASVALGVLLPAAAIVVLWRYGRGRAINDASAPAGIDSALVFSLTAGAFVSLLAVVVSRPVSRLARLVSARWLRWLGQISYGLYLIHLPIFYLVSMLHPSAAWAKGACMVLGVVVALALARLSWRYFESPFLKLKPGYR